MKIRVLAEQTRHASQPDRGPLASGSEVDLDPTWAAELLNRGEAELIVTKTVDRAEKRPGTRKSEKR